MVYRLVLYTDYAGCSGCILNDCIENDWVYLIKIII